MLETTRALCLYLSLYHKATKKYQCKKIRTYVVMKSFMIEKWYGLQVATDGNTSTHQYKVVFLPFVTNSVEDSTTFVTSMLMKQSLCVISLSGVPKFYEILWVCSIVSKDNIHCWIIYIINNRVILLQLS